MSRKQPTHTNETQVIGEADRMRLDEEEAEAARVREAKAAEKAAAAEKAKAKDQKTKGADKTPETADQGDQS